jgi:uncharacterized protein
MRSKSRAFFLATLCAAFLSACGAAGRTAVVMPEDAEGIRVIGEGHADGAPDIAIFRVGVEARRPSVGEARETAANAQRALLEALASAGVSQSDVRTAQLTVAPDYEYSETGRRLLGYVVTNTVEVKVRDLDRLEGAIDGALAAGGDLARLEGLSFEVDDPADLEARARAAAIENARHEAEQIASALGVSLGEPIAIEEISASAPSPVMMRMEQAQDSTPIEPGSSRVTAQVRVRWAIN